MRITAKRLSELTQVPAATGAARTASYVAAVEALEAWLAAPVRPRTSP